MPLDRFLTDSLSFTKGLSQNLTKVTQPQPTETWLVTSDMQPKYTADIQLWKTRLAKLKTRHTDLAISLIAGDIVDNGDSSDQSLTNPPYTFEQILTDLTSYLPTPLDKTFAISGNHDIDYGGNPQGNSGSSTQYGRTYNTFLRHFARQYWYIRRGNIVVIGMGCMARNTGGNITDYVVSWWRDIVERHQDCVIITMIHQPVSGTFSSTETGSQYGSERLIAVLEAATSRVDLVFSGHVGVPSTDSNGGFIQSHNTTFWNTQGMGAGYASNYTLMKFTNGSNQIVLERRDGDTGEILASISHTITSHNQVQLNRDMNVNTNGAYDERTGVMAWPQLITTNVPRYPTSNPTVYASIAAPTPVLMLQLEDKANENVKGGAGPGIVFNVPGAVSGGAYSNHAYGTGAMIAGVRLYESDTNYTAALDFYASGGSGDISSLVKTLRSTTTGLEMHAQIIKTPFSSDAAQPIVRFAQMSGGVSGQFQCRGDGGEAGWSTQPAVFVLAKTAAGRSLNASGTINANGADYAEYFEVIPALYSGVGERPVAKGDIIGINSQGKLTDRFADVVGAFLIKSTLPNLVGNDQWGKDEHIATKYNVSIPGDMPVVPTEPPAPAIPLGATVGQQEAVFAQYAQALDVYSNNKALYDAQLIEWNNIKTIFDAALATERQHWDRLALRGQVPMNLPITHDDIGKLVIPAATSDGGITAILVSKDDVTMPQYARKLGEIVGVESDNRARVLV